MARAKRASVAVEQSAPRMTKQARDEQRKYEVQDALRTITRADEVQRDKPLMREVKALARDQQKTLQKITGGGRTRK